MRQDTDSLTDALLYAGGMSDRLPELRGDQADRLLEALTVHKVLGRFLERLSSGRNALPFWLREKAEALYDAQMAVVAQRDADVAWLTERSPPIRPGTGSRSYASRETRPPPSWKVNGNAG
ncbi:hypothetical protein [Streptomyces sp. MP131-18]|uniref:hypothetical protein n=1 Tax=Streptomyces sp. MP131-18 TaxID=1857892 RepID=UPI00097BF1FF|nr:hypothetical protein [Streptomyces sp. MP131-18]ONK16092.1 hypothetical protein STBA_69420 [Streptomyces sp. MP131-18]